MPKRSCIPSNYPSWRSRFIFNTEHTEESQSTQRRTRRRFAPFVERFESLDSPVDNRHGRSVPSVTPLCSLCLIKPYISDQAFPERAKLHQPVAVQAHG